MFQVQTLKCSKQTLFPPLLDPQCIITHDALLPRVQCQRGTPPPLPYPVRGPPPPPLDLENFRVQNLKKLQVHSRGVEGSYGAILTKTWSYIPRTGIFVSLPNIFVIFRQELGALIGPSNLQSQTFGVQQRVPCPLFYVDFLKIWHSFALRMTSMCFDCCPIKRWVGLLWWIDLILVKISKF